MKLKTKILAAVAMTAFALSASAAEVYSSNTVGYTKLQLNPGYNMIGVQFLNVGGTVKDINDIISLDSGMAGINEDYAFQTTMQVWNGSSYTSYGWFDADDGDDPNMQWPDANSKWILDDQSDLATAPLNIGTGFWINTPSASTITVAGELASTDSSVVPVSAGYNLICNPLPQAVNIQKIQPSSELLGIDSSLNFQTTLMVWTGSSYTKYGWFDADDGDDPNMQWHEANSKWILDDQSDLANVEIDVGEGFWIISPSAAGSVTFTK